MKMLPKKLYGTEKGANIRSLGEEPHKADGAMTGSCLPDIRPNLHDLENKSYPQSPQGLGKIPKLNVYITSQ